MFVSRPAEARHCANVRGAAREARGEALGHGPCCRCSRTRLGADEGAAEAVGVAEVVVRRQVVAHPFGRSERHRERRAGRPFCARYWLICLQNAFSSASRTGSAAEASRADDGERQDGGGGRCESVHARRSTGRRRGPRAGRRRHWTTDRVSVARGGSAERPVARPGAGQRRVIPRSSRRLPCEPVRRRRRASVLEAELRRPPCQLRPGSVPPAAARAARASRR